MPRGKSAKSNAEQPRARRRFTEEFKAEAVQMLRDGHTAASICERLGLSGPNVLYRWKRSSCAGAVRRPWAWRLGCVIWKPS